MGSLKTEVSGNRAERSEDLSTEAVTEVTYTYGQIRRRGASKQQPPQHPCRDEVDGGSDLSALKIFIYFILERECM